MLLLDEFDALAKRRDLANAKPDPVAVAHGTAVTAAATFGLMVPGSQLPQPLAQIDHYRIHPPDGWPNDLAVVWVLDEIERVVGNEDYKIVNLSYGPNQAMEADNEPDRWTVLLTQTVLLDQIAYERDVSFCGGGWQQRARAGPPRAQSGSGTSRRRQRLFCRCLRQS